jgi:hypothetical protein
VLDAQASANTTTVRFELSDGDFDHRVIFRFKENTGRMGRCLDSASTTSTKSVRVAIIVKKE